MKQLVTLFLRIISRISIRIMIFNLLLVFLPLASVMYLDVYEKQLLKNQENSMVQQGRIVSAALSGYPEIRKEDSLLLLRNLDRKTTSRIRIINRNREVLADSSVVQVHKKKKATVSEREESSVQKPGLSKLLYDGFTSAVRIYRSITSSGRSEWRYDSQKVKPNLLDGPEISSALAGRYGAGMRYLEGKGYAVLHVGIPVFYGDEATGAVLITKSTYGIMDNLFEIRQSILVISLLSVGAAVLFSLLASFTITSPLKKLKEQASAIVYRRGKLSGNFSAAGRCDEIGELADSLAELTERLEEHIKYVESFSADVSHEFKNPLASIRAAGEILSTAEGNDERERFSAIVLEGVNRMDRLLSGVRELTSVETSLEQNSPQSVEMNKLCGTIVEGSRIHYAAILFRKYDGGPLYVAGDPDKLSRALENIIQNAVSFSRDGDISVVLGRKKNMVHIEIADQGGGIPEENLPMIFKRFFSYRPEGEEDDHSGLGLSIVQSIVHGHQGRIWAYNNNRGGATFVLEFPLLQTK